MPKEPDRHEKGATIIRLPAEYVRLLRLIKKKTGRPFTYTTQIALEHQARALGIPFPHPLPNWPEAT
jgi:hypothetical protein